MNSEKFKVTARSRTWAQDSRVALSSLPGVVGRRLGWMACVAWMVSSLGCASEDDGSSQGNGGSGATGGQGGAGGQGGTGGQGGGSDERIRLRVPLYPYIPDAAGDRFEAMVRRMKREFETLHPEVELELNPPCFQDDPYDPAALARGMSGENEACSFDLVEIDTSLLGELVDTGAVTPWSALPSRNWHPAAIEASTYQGALYGVPHWMCSHFVFSRSAAVANASSVSELVSALADLQTPEPDMAGNLLGSWNLPALYLDAWADTNGAGGVASAISATALDPQAISGLKMFSETCESGGLNPCLDGTFDAEDVIDPAMAKFSAGQVDAAFGFSERLFPILKALPVGADPAEIEISSAPLGHGSHPLVFTDSFMLSARCTGACADAAAAFVAYMSEATTFEWVLSSEDAPAQGRVPRYLMPAALEAYATPKLSQDRFYMTIESLMQDGVNYPNSGLYPVKNAMRDNLLDALTSP
ncbi:extracellular solute-binding protein [Chondromyces crocatus]|uniref:Sugar ABC transporter substrate-binding protein n=1 Tax=Chondromyces crocatus TaxID=52 RepID=A0A0K1ECY2_CHOCO|nr:extracellular solute-binding protein [Chondromyces crocatus]AKT38433.1 uncharacterized protein CMC5_025790 [Chondromyces crocatus]